MKTRLATILLCGVLVTTPAWAGGDGSKPFLACVETTGQFETRLDLKIRPEGGCPKGQRPVSWPQQGPTGPQGPKGDKGIDGINGHAGPKGDTGSHGSIGPAGHTGAQGPVGPRGVHGVRGPHGPAGPQGPQGPPGAAGHVSCPAGSTAEQITVNSPGGHKDIVACVVS